MTLPMQDIAPTEKRKPMRAFFVADILILHSIMSGTDRSMKSKAIWTMLRVIPIEFASKHLGADGRAPYFIKPYWDRAGLQANRLRETAVMI